MNATPLQQILHSFRTASVTEREKGTYFEELIRLYLQNEPTYADLYSDVWMLSDVPPEFGISTKDTGIDLVARTRGTGEFHAIQCKFYAEGYRVQKSDIDSFFTASGQKPFTHRIIVTTTNNWTENAEKSLIDQQPPVSRIDLQDLEDSLIDWTKYKPKAAAKLKPKFAPLKHQKRAIDAVLRGLKEADRGKLIMACGTGKTFTALKISELMAGKNKRVLFLVPSLALLSQTLTEWTHQSTTPLHSFAVCSDAEVGKKREAQEDVVQPLVHELRYPATTDAERLAFEMTKRHDAEHMSVVFSTYHSISVIHRAQEKFGLAPFDLIVCDEAHRTTGATFENEDESEFVRIHDADYIRGTKRLYMTATPRVYGNAAKAKADQESITLCSMDDEALYGKQLHIITFSQAVEEQLLTDYKVIVLAVDEDHVNARLQKLLSDENNQLKVDDAARIVGCWKALSKQGLASDLSGDKSPMRKAVAFCQVIEPSTGKKQHKVSSKLISDMFQSVVDAYRETADDPASQLICEAAHVDGTMNATEKEAKINWLKAGTPDNVCRILSNVRCLSEGVDVPALDAVLFLSPRSSQVEVVQSVGRVMRKAPGKKLGYVILPVVIPAGMQPHDALNDNKVYKVVWEVLQALRSHDDRFDAFVNRLDLLGSPQNRMEVIAITDALAPKAKKPSSKPKDKAKGQFSIGADDVLAKGPVETQRQFQFQVGELEKALYAKLVKKCGNRMFWDDWANDIAKIAQTHIGRIHAILKSDDNAKEIKAFREFADELRDDLNDSITDDEVVEMLAQHLITKPVFDALFKDYSFASHNPVSQGMQKVLDLLNEHHLEKEADTLESFYASIRRRAEGIDNAEGKQKIVVELYDKFFRKAFPKMTERLGIVYTPVEVVDFIIHSINDLLQSEFGQTLGSKGVHILDPFTGTGTFITRLLQSGLIKPEELAHKYKHEIHANEIVLLAYYIAAINIEAVYHSLLAKNGDKAPQYQPFEGICLTDTFQMYEKEDLLSALMVDNSARRKRQKKLDIRVIMGNPPYSKGQDSANDNNQNVAYPVLDERIRKTYAAQSAATNNNSLYDSYIRAIRWASERIQQCGVIGFVTNAGWVDGRASDGLRKCLVEEFSSIHLFHLRGNQRTSGEQSRKEGGKIFGSGSRAPIAITLLVKNPQATERGQVFFHDIGDYLTAAEKLQRIATFGSVAGITAAKQWDRIAPDANHDWLKQKDESFSLFAPIGAKGTNDSMAIFDTYSRGVATSRDTWCYNFSRRNLSSNMKKLITFYTNEVERFEKLVPVANKAQRDSAVDDFTNNDPSQISWSRSLKHDLSRGRDVSFVEQSVIESVYRPYTKSWLYFNRQLNDMVYLMPCLFPKSEFVNYAIVVKQRWAGDGQLSLMVNRVVDLQSDGGCQCFPLYIYDKTGEVDSKDRHLFPVNKEKVLDGYTRRDAITDAGLAHFQAAFPSKGEGNAITKEDLFYYIYGLLHSPEYLSRFADNLSKELPRIPAVKQFTDFMAFSEAGRGLAHWHLNYETVECFPAKIELTGGATKLAALAPEQYRVVKMKHPKVKDPETGKSVNDRSTVIYNEYITVTGIPLDAYDYVVNGKAAIEWVMERQAVTTDKDSGIVNDANLWATETMNNPKYPLELLLRVITVSLETNRIVNSLPKLEID